MMSVFVCADVCADIHVEVCVHKCLCESLPPNSGVCSGELVTLLVGHWLHLLGS